MAFHCPHCSRPLYSRRRKTCEFCGAEIPESLLLTPRQQQALDAMKRADRKAHSEFMDRLAADAGIDIGFSSPD